MTKALQNAKTSRILFVMCWIVYGFSYIGRLNYSAALAGMIESGTFTRAQGGLIGTVFFVCYGGGQLIAGYLGDRISPFKMIGTGLFLATLANAMMFFSKSYPIMLLFWGINGLGNSMLWSPILYIISHLLVKEHRKRACLSIASTVPCGTLAAYLLSMLLLKFYPYQSVFLGAAVILGAVWCTWMLVTGRIQTQLIPQDDAEMTVSDSADSLQPESAAEADNTDDAEPQVQTHSFWPLLLSTGVIFSILPIIFQGMLNIGITTWVPTIIMDVYTVSPVFSLLLSMFLPLVNLLGAYITTFLDDHIFHSETKTAFVMFLFVLLPIGALLHIGKLPATLCVVLLAMVTTSMTGINHMIITMIPFRMSRLGKAATLTGFLNAMAYVGSAISNYGFGKLADNFGWNTTILFWAVLAFISALLCAVASVKWTPFVRRLEK